MRIAIIGRHDRCDRRPSVYRGRTGRCDQQLPIWFRHLGERARPDLRADDRHAIFVAGDDELAKRVVTNLIDEIGFGAVDTGSLAEGGRCQQPGTALYNKVMTAREGREAVGHAT